MQKPPDELEHTIIALLRSRLEEQADDRRAFEMDVDVALGIEEDTFRGEREPGAGEALTFILDWLRKGSPADLQADVFRLVGRFAETSAAVTCRRLSAVSVYEIVTGNKEHRHRLTIRVRNHGPDQSRV